MHKGIGRDNPDKGMSLRYQRLHLECHSAASQAARLAEHMAQGGIKAHPRSSWQENSDCSTRIRAGVSSKRGNPGRTNQQRKAGGQHRCGENQGGFIPLCNGGFGAEPPDVGDHPWAIQHILCWSELEAVSSLAPATCTGHQEGAPRSLHTP